jgi:hypothetical protein
MLLCSLKERGEKSDDSRKSLANELAQYLGRYTYRLPWHPPDGLDLDRVSLELLEFAWRTLGWREGFVDQSELHILVRSGGTEIHDDEPEGIDIAIVGPDENEQLVVEFLPMIGVDPEARDDARDAGIALIERTVDRGHGNPWQYAKHHCGTGANMYSRVRFVPRGGREPWRRLKSGTYTETEFVRKQLGRIEQLEQSERLRFFEAYDAVAFELERESGPITGYLMQLTYDSLAVELSMPTRTGCMLRNVRSHRERRYLIDADGRLNDFGIQKLVGLVNALQRAVDAMEDRIADIQAAAETTLERSKSANRPHNDDEYVMQIWEAVPGPRLGVDVTFFCCIVESWIWHCIHGLIAPDGWGQSS